MKFLTAKKRTLLIALAVISALIAVIILSIVTAASSAVAPNGMTVVIDAGHGGRDGGVVGTTGVKESEVNLGIAKSLRHFLTEAGYKVVMTRETDTDLAGGGGSFKQSDMRARKEIIENANADLMISIHQNSYPRKDICGAQVFYAASSERGKAYAETMQSVLNGTLGSDRVAKSGDYYIIQCSETPSVLIECGFLSNPKEESLLVTATYQQKVAYSIMTGVRVILEEERAVQPSSSA